MPLFDLKPMKMLEALRFWASLKIFKRSEFDKLSAEARRQAFTVSGVASEDQVERVWEAAFEAIGKGTTRSDFRKGIPDIIEKSGWSNSRVDLIFRTATNNGYANGRYDQMIRVAESRPYWQYIAVQDDRTRDAHAEMAGRVFRYHDPIWEIWYPYRGKPWQWYSCRCSIRTLSERQIQRYGLKVEMSKNAENQFAALERTIRTGIFNVVTDDECAEFLSMIYADALMENMEEMLV